MQLPIGRNRGNFLPGGVPRINWSNPITAGMIACYVPSASGGSVIPNLVGNGIDLRAESGARWANLAEGQGITSLASTSGADCVGVPTSLRPVSAMSCFWRGSLNGSTPGTNTPLMGITYANTDSSPYFVFAVCDGAATQNKLGNYWNSSGVAANSAQIAPPAANKISSIVGTITLGGNSYLYVDGVLKDTTAASSGTFSYSGAETVSFGTYKGVLSRQANCTGLIGVMWNRQISPAEAAYLNSNPYDFLIYPEDDMFAEIQGSGIFFDAASNSGYQTTQSSYSWSHTCTGSNRYLVVGIAMLSLAQTVTSITYAGQDLRLIGVKASVSGACRVEMWGIIAPATGSNTIAVTLSGAISSAGCASSYTGVHQSSPIEGFNTAQATNVGAADATVNVTTVADLAMCVDIVCTSDTAITVGAGQTQRANVTGAAGSGAMSTEGPTTPAGVVTMSWTNVDALATWSIASTALRPAPAAGLASKVFRKTLSGIGTRVGNRQSQG